MLREITVILLIWFVGWAYQATRPPPPNVCGSPGGPAITAPRIKLRDGRHLAYMEHGVSKQMARYKIIFIHGFGSCRHDAAIARNLSPVLFEYLTSLLLHLNFQLFNGCVGSFNFAVPCILVMQEVVDELGLYVVSFDRPGYGESDPDPKRTTKSLALDVEEIADQLELGSKFYVVGFSMGGQAVWSCLKFIPHRLAGAALIAPVINYWWPGFPANLSKEAYYLQLPQDQWALRIAHYAPWLTYWWNTQTLFPSSAVAARRPEIFSPEDVQLLSNVAVRQTNTAQEALQQGAHESIHRDMMIGFGTWEFDPMDLENPFPNSEGSVHLWHGDDDRLVPVILQRYISRKLPWVHYHEIPGSGHLLAYADGVTEVIVKALLLGEKVTSSRIN